MQLGADVSRACGCCFRLCQGLIWRRFRSKWGRDWHTQSYSAAPLLSWLFLGPEKISRGAHCSLGLEKC